MEALEASIAWLHAEFVALRTDFVAIVEEAEDTQKRKGSGTPRDLARVRGSPM